jgi:hypothetical protein
MTVDEIRAMVRLSTMVDSGEISDAELLTFINEGIMDVSMRDNWEWLEAETTFTTVAATQAYTESDTVSGDEWQEVIFVTRSGDDEPLHPISMRQAHARWGDDVESGTPQFYYIYKESIYLAPIPDAAETIKVHYVPPPSELTAGSDTPAWLSTYHHVLVDYVESRVWAQQEDYSKSQISLARYFDRIDEMRRAYGKRTNTGPWVVGASRSVYTGRNEPFRNDWGVSDVSP